MQAKILQLNADYTPVRVISWEKAICLWYADKVEIVEDYPTFELVSVNFTMKCPAVVKLKKYVSGVQKKVKYSKIAVFNRDHFTCLYCGKQPGTNKLTLDHVIPRCRGGETSWSNGASACQPCNQKKGDRTPEEAGMKLAYQPYKPEVQGNHSFTVSLGYTPEPWINYLGSN
jgi:5-methylcytosine-specific restriction endonuclease McrA